MELIKLIEHLRTISEVIENFNPIEIKINNPKSGLMDRWECNLIIRWDLKIVNQFANLGYNFTNEGGLVGEHDDDEYFGFLIIIK